MLVLEIVVLNSILVRMIIDVECVNFVRLNLLKWVIDGFFILVFFFGLVFFGLVMMF